MQGEQAVYFGLHFFNLFTKEALADALQELMTQEQTVEFFGAEPEARQLVGRVPLLIVEIAVVFAVVFQRQICERFEVEGSAPLPKTLAAT